MTHGVLRSKPAQCEAKRNVFNWSGTGTESDALGREYLRTSFT